MIPWSQRKQARQSFEKSDEKRQADHRRLLVNLVGAPGTGKSTLASAYCRDGSWAFLSIDEYMIGGLEHRDAWESMITHSRLHPRVIVESSGLSKHLRRLLKYRHHATIIVTSSTAKRRRDTRIKPRNIGAERFGSMDQLAKACERLPEIYPRAIVVSADGPFAEVFARFTAAMMRAEAHAAAGGDPPPTMPRKHAPNLSRSHPARRARRAVERALAKGDLVRPDRCDHCGKVGKVQGHHDDHSRPLDIMWLCLPCHRRQDRKVARRR